MRKSEFQINTYTASHQLGPSVTGLSDGGFVVTWASEWQDGSAYGIYGQRYDANGEKLESVNNAAPYLSTSSTLTTNRGPHNRHH